MNLDAAGSVQTPAQIYAPGGGVPIRNSRHDDITVLKASLYGTGSC